MTTVDSSVKFKMGLGGQGIGSFQEILYNARKAIQNDQKALLTAAAGRLERGEKQKIEDAIREKKEKEEKERRKAELAMRKKKDEEDRLAMEKKLAAKRKERALERERQEMEKKALRASKKAGGGGGASRSASMANQIRSIGGEEVPIDVSAMRAMKAKRAAAKLFEDDEPRRSSAVGSRKAPIRRTSKLQKKEYVIIPDSVLDKKGGKKAVDPKLAHLSARMRLKKSFNPNEHYALNTNKRDTRTIDEVERDLREKRLGKDVSSNGGSSGAGSSKKREREDQELPGSYYMQRTAPTWGGSVSALAASSALAKKDNRKDNYSDLRPTKKLKVMSEKESMFSDSEDDFLDEEEEEPRYRGYQTKRYLPDDVLSELRRGRAPLHKNIYDDFSSDEDMEADAEELRKEEAKSARLARLEDEREEKRLKQLEEEKKRKKAEAARKQ